MPGRVLPELCVARPRPPGADLLPERVPPELHAAKPLHLPGAACCQAASSQSCTPPSRCICPEQHAARLRPPRAARLQAAASVRSSALPGCLCPDLHATKPRRLPVVSSLRLFSNISISLDASFSSAHRQAKYKEEEERRRVAACREERGKKLERVRRAKTAMEEKPDAQKMGK
jgi:hypothetical protein